ncbi:MBL fold metallo-hydrolase [Paenibacillus hamazuiensis]|uniref:MBL fold metallo-hydrolase n=1 Tax=Paenibacillus hamazuiensis TaxID=2936508 RepID=UPI00200C3EBF|nr:ribonuclease Z [Paenibacillus hamazuiensis]
MNVFFMGTASAAGSKERDNTYLLLQNNEESWMVDVGGNPLGKLKQASIPIDRIKGVIFTHFHVDHIYGLPSLLWGMWIAGRKEPLTLFCPQPNEAQLRSILQSYQAAEWPIGFDIVIRPYEWEQENVIVDQPDFRISTFQSLHGVPASGIAVQNGGQVLIYSADTGPNEWIANQPRIDVLIHEATRARGRMSTHTSLEDLLAFYPIDRIGKVYAVHLTDGEPYGEVLAGSSDAAKSKVELACDMMSITV